MLALASQIESAARRIRQVWSGSARAGIILGTGLGGLADQIETEAVLDYAEIPHFPRPTAIGHAGKLVCGRLAGVPVVAMEGRFHAYEGYSHPQITFPVRVLKALGADLLVVSNAAGGMNPELRRGDIVLLEDHINLMGGNPLVGVNDEQLGPRFPDMWQPYTLDLIERAERAARKAGFTAPRGVLVAVLGPNLETRAEYRFLRKIGGDVVSMSTVPEVIVAVHAGMRVLGLSVVTDLCLPESLQPVNIAEIIATAHQAAPKLQAIVLGVLAEEGI